MIVKTIDPIITIKPVILDVWSSKPYPKSIIRCLISLKIWNKNDHVRPKIINLPKKEFKKNSIVSYLLSPSKSSEAQRHIKVIATMFIIPVILWAMDTKDEICHL